MRARYSNLALTAFSAASIGFAFQASADTIINASGIDPTYSVFIVAVDGGFYEEEGLDAEYRLFESGSAAAEVVVTGNAHITSGSELSGIGFRDRGAPLVIIASAMRSDRQMGAIAREGIEAPEDLVGQTVGVSFGNASQFYWSLYASHYGLSEEEITVTNIGPPEMVPALATGQIDAYFVWEPWLENGLRTVENANRLHRSGDDDVYTLDMAYLIHEDLLEDTETLHAMMRALDNATNFINEEREQAAEMVSQAMNIELEDTLNIMEGLNFEVRLEQSFLEGQEDAAAWMLDAGLIDESPELIGGYIRPEVMQELFPDRVDF
ncbi:ABC transporter substrate-binding protein [Billgrantia endophytica]|nr:ABC transporter substrate-binding protein [Halomonas endophytica]